MSSHEHRGLSVGSIVAGKLRVVRVLGEGGMGAVYEVEHEFTKHRRAMKLLHAEMTKIPGVVQRFLREASAAGRIGNPHIIETFDAGTLESGEPYLVMEYLDGRPLDTIVEERGPLDFDEAVDLIRQACDGIQAAHEAGIVHRDIKPENLFLVGDDPAFVKILDFGISKFDPGHTGDHALTQEGAALGTPFYMPPEQVRGESDLDARADVYALGVVLYECVTGRKPFMADSLPHIAVLIHEGKYEPISALRPNAPPGLEQVIARAMAVDRNARYPTVRAFSEALSTIGAPELSAGTVVADSTAVDGTPDAVRQAETGPLPPRQNDSAVVAETAGAPRVGRGRAALFGLVVLLVVGGLVAMLLAPGQADPEAEPSAEAPAEPPSEAPRAAATPEPSVSPVIANPTEESSSNEQQEERHDEQAPTPKEESPAAPPSPRPRATRKPAPSPAAPAGQEQKTNRASEHGLAEENPF